MFFIIGIILEIIASILSFFLPTVYTRDWEYGKISGIGKVLNQGGQTRYTLVNLYGVLTILFLCIVIITCIIYLVLFLKKKDNLIPKFVLAIVFLFPIGLMIASKISLSVEGEFIGNKTAVYGSGTSSGYTGLGWFLMILMFVSLFLVVVGLITNKVNENCINKTVSKTEIKINENKKINNINEDDFKM